MNVKKCVRALLCLYLTLIIAMDAVKAQALKVGDTLPPELWSMPLQVVNHPTGKDCITLEEYKDKLIILDFWATWCAPCIKSLTKLDTLQKEFSEQLAVIPITYENAEKVLPFLTKRGYQLPSVINDSTLKKSFPHRSIPHQVWVQDGKVMAVTGAEYATRENISNTLNKEKVQMLMKEEDMEFDASKPLLSKIDPVFYSSRFSGKVNVSSAGISRRDNGLTIYNVHLKTLIREAFIEDIPFYGRKNRIIIDTVLLKTPDFGETDRRYTYYLELPNPVGREEAYRIFKSDLLNFLKTGFSIDAVLSHQRRRCLVLEGLNTELSKGGEYSYQNNPEEGTILTNGSARQLSDILASANWENPLPLVSKLQPDTKLDVVLKGDLKDIGNLSAQLQKYGISLIEKEEEVEVLQIMRIGNPHY
jgi:thiol-disulfide isomerase/thioredoxin